MLKYSLFSVVLLLSTTYATSQDLPTQDCPSELDAIPNSVFVTDKGGNAIYIRKTEDIGRLEANLTDGDLAELTMEALKKRAEETFPGDILKAADDIASTSASQDLDVAVPYFYRTCPYRWYVLWQYYWYWKVSYTDVNGVKTIEYWWSPWWVWGTYCGHLYCHWSYWPNQWFDLRYRCFPEYRLIRLPMFCYKRQYFSSGITATWSSWRWRYVWVPRGCCCRKYWWFAISASSNTCPAQVP